MNETAIKDKAESLADKMNKITAKFELAESVLVDSEDIEELIVEKQKDIELYQDEINPLEIVQLETMVEDFKFCRDTLRESIENGRRVLNSVTLDLLDSDGEQRAALILSFAELNKSITDSTKLYMLSYKEMSTIILNIDKVRKTISPSPTTVHNTLNVNTSEAISTADLIKRLTSK